MHIHRDHRLPFTPSDHPPSLMVVWSSSHRAAVFMSAPGTCLPSSCTWCLWKVYISHHTCPVGSPSALLGDENTSDLVVVVVFTPTEHGVTPLHSASPKHEICLVNWNWFLNISHFLKDPFRWLFNNMLDIKNYIVRSYIYCIWHHLVATVSTCMH